jgi:hypothetical protein
MTAEGTGDAAMPAAPASRRKTLWELATTRGVPRRSLVVAVIVGTVLNLINQYDALPGAGGPPFDVVKALLTYCVPFCVATYGAVTARRAFGE